jgi:sec-independent protein translocase protein TatB
MGEFRRASNEFRMQMEEELRLSEQAEQQKKIAAMEAAAPPTPAISDGTENTIAAPADTSHDFSSDGTSESASQPETTPLPIATSGDLNLMPPSTGLPIESSSISHAFDSVPHVEAPGTTFLSDPSEGHTPDAPDHVSSEAQLHG